MQAKAAVLYEPGQALEMEQLEVLPPRAGEVLVRYVASGVCHSDLHHIQGLVPWPTPVVLGHEGAGVVEEIGPGVTGVQVGDHVLTSYIPACGSCPWCVVGRPNMCDLRDTERHVMPDGTARFRKGDAEIYHYLQVSSYAERAVLPQQSVVPIRKDAPLDVVCLISCGVMTGAGAVINRAKVVPGSSVAVFGCGGVGLNAIQAAALMGAARIIAVDVFDQKLEWSREFGATHLVNAAKEDPVQRVHQICGREGADYAIEAVGGAKTMEQAFNAVHRGGTVVVIGVSPTGTRLSIDPTMLLQERVLTGTSFGSSRQRVDLPMFVDLFMEGKYRLRELISRQIELEDLNRAYESLERGEVRRSVVRYE
ncbi:MAG TPA: Zn-dependent alcohol dehydrogenase [Chloroflexota bacterium]|nr:Zn-dependent alcohol dehydrogenase [Chloroflexota bacterium]